MPDGSPARVVVAAALLLALAAGAVWGVLEWRAASTGPGPRAPNSEPAAATPSPPPSPDVENPPVRDLPSEPVLPAPSPEPDPPATPELADESPPDDGPATGPYAAFSPSHQLTHPDTDPDIRRWYDWFGYFVDDEVGVPSGQWTNKAELWDELVLSIAREAEELGAEIRQPRFAGMEVVPAVVNVRWSNEDTGGRGELVEFSAVYASTDGDSRERYWPVLIETKGDGSGVIVEQMEPFELETSDFSTFPELRAEAGERQWQWVLGQPVQDR